MSSAARGLDMSVATILSSSREATQAKKILKSTDALPEGVEKKSVIPYNHRGTLSLMHVYDDEQKTFHRVVVHRPVKAVEFYLGRATRGFYGVDLDERAVVYVKDAWRSTSSRSAPEAATYRRLNAQDVPHLPGFYHGGDVPADTPALLKSPSTVSTPFAMQATVSGEPGSTVYTHHRLLFKNIGRPLKTFKSTHQLCTVLQHALEAHGAAYEKAKVLHRDISGGNILVDKDGRGMLIDWDMCVWCENTEEMERIGQPIGTWPFISADLLMAEDLRAHLLRDDLESFMHVLYYHVFRYRPIYPEGSHERSVLVARFNDVYDGARWRVPSGRIVGGTEKANVLNGCTFNNGELRRNVRPIPLLGLLEDVRDTFKPLYCNEPVPSMFSADDERYTEELEKLEEYKAEHATALTQLQSPEYMISLFRYWTEASVRDGHQWTLDDGAVDMFAPRPTGFSESRSSRKRAVAVEDAPTPASKVPRRGSSRDMSASMAARTCASEGP